MGEEGVEHPFPGLPLVEREEEGAGLLRCVMGEGVGVPLLS